ncbi:hypothetical protein VP01_56g5 [Puccinia sorghi]|uniref:Acyl-protein thioesterase 1 n=1 Tax=Puccinia sorghi TaxID=27349 RepID=A0A0L6UJF0_9BASI|nr:hypothetical protein VP01_56g5 [Puccinia sorghi]
MARLADPSQRLIPAIPSSPADDTFDVYMPGARWRSITQQPTDRRATRILATTKPSLRVAMTGSAVILFLMLCLLYFAYRSSLPHVQGLARTAINDSKSGWAPNNSWSAREGWPEELQPLEYTLLPAVKPSSSGNWTCVLLHGLGDHQASDSFRLRQALLSLSPALFEPMAFIIPVADSLPVSVFAGQLRPAWFDIRNWTHLHQHEDVLHMHTNVRRLIHIISRNNLDLTRTIIAGFSQGFSSGSPVPAPPNRKGNKATHGCLVLCRCGHVSSPRAHSRPPSGGPDHAVWLCADAEPSGGALQAAGRGRGAQYDSAALAARPSRPVLPAPTRPPWVPTPPPSRPLPPT